MKLPLASLEVFNAIAQNGSFRAAALALGIKPSTVSHQLKNLEQQLGTSLFVRTSRSVSLTEAGRALASGTGPGFEQIANGLETALSTGHDARGALKLALPEVVFHLFLCERLISFQQAYPEIEIELSITDELSDILDEGLHAGFRLGRLVAQDMVAIPLTPSLRAATVASPAYLDRNGAPSSPQDLLSHNCLSYRFHSSRQLAPWMFSGPDGDYQVDVKGGVIVNSSALTVDLAQRGMGIAYVFRDQCEDALNRGDLIELLEHHQVVFPSIHIYFPQEYRSMVPLRLMIEHLKERPRC